MRAMSAAGMRDAGTREGGGPSRSFRITCAIASARIPSVPGAAASHSSALIPVSDSRGPTCTNLAGGVSRPPWNAWARVKAF